ncbi:MAG: Trm112 family protein [Wenzhouxiangella sp.]
MTLPDHLLDILCCPVSHEPLLPLSRDKLGKLNAAINAGDVQFVDNEPVTDALAAALITRDGKVVYAIEEGIPVLLPERGIGTTQLKEAL